MTQSGSKHDPVARVERSRRRTWRAQIDYRGDDATGIRRG